MKRKFTCMILALVLVISLLPLGAIHTQAASNLNYSENVVSLIKQFEGFSAVAYWDVGLSAMAPPAMPIRPSPSMMPTWHCGAA